MQKKYLVLAVSAALLTACGGGDSKVENLPEKSWQAIAPFYTETAYSSWKLDPAPKATGDSSNAKIEYAPHQWSLGPKESPKKLVINFPASITQVKVISNKAAEYSSDYDLAKWGISFPTIKVTLEGDFKTIYQKDLDSKTLLKFDGASKGMKLSYSFPKLNVESTSEYGPQTINYQFNDNGKQTSIAGNWSIKSIKNSQKMSADNSPSIDTKYTTEESISKLEWKNIDNVLVANYANLLACFSVDRTGNSSLEAGNCLLKYIQQGTLGQLTIGGSFKNYSMELNLVDVLPTGPIQFKMGEMLGNIGIDEKDGLITFNTSFNIKNIDVIVDEAKLPPSVTAYYPVAKSFLPKELSYEIKFANLKRSSIQDLKDVAQSATFDLGKFKADFDVNYVNSIGFIKLNANFTAPDSLKAADFNSMDNKDKMKLASISIQIQNFDKWVDAVAKINAQAPLFAGMIKGYGVANAKDPSILEFKVAYDAGNPLINGKELPF